MFLSPHPPFRLSGNAQGSPQWPLTFSITSGQFCPFSETRPGSVTSSAKPEFLEEGRLQSI